LDDIPLSALSIALILLLVASAFFSMSETSMMAANRYRLRHRAAQGQHGPRLALALLERTDRLLGVILLGNNLVNAAAATLVSVIAIELFGEEKWALGAGTVLVTFLILVCSEITPKIVAATHADRVAPVLAFLLWPLLRAAWPIVWFVNLFAAALLRLLRANTAIGGPQLTTEELRSIVADASHLLPAEHRSIVINLFDLEKVTVEDVMVPRGEIEAIDLSRPIDELIGQLATSFHTRLPVYEGEPNEIIGILHQRRLLAHALEAPLGLEEIRSSLSEPYFVPATTPIYAQLRFFRENRQRIGLVVDEYGELMGLVTLEDIVEEIVGKFTTSMPGASANFRWQKDGTALLDGGHSLREVNRLLGLDLPLDGPKTLNGLILETLQDIPAPGVSVRIGKVTLEIVQTEDRRVKVVRLYRPQ